MLGSILAFWFKFPEKFRFLLVGGWNTLCSLLIFAFLYETLKYRMPYEVVLIINHIISVFQTFISLRFFVFRSNANSAKEVIKEFVKANALYSILLIANLILLYFFVEFGKLNVILSQVVVTCILTILSYFGNKHFIFK